MGGARSDLPRVALRREDDEVLAALRALQCVALKHPVAFQSAFAALVAEGRRFAATDEGAAWSARLAGSALLQRARLALEVGTLWMLEDEPRGPLPSAYLDALFLAASGSELESLVDRVFEEMLDAER
jgi:hypothetical protein